MTTTGGAIIAAVSGTDYATPSQITSSYPFTTTTHFGTTTSATSTPLFLRGNQFALFASSTSVFTNASTTQLTIGADFISDFSSGLAISAAGVVTVDDVTAVMLVSGDFGDFSCNGTVCSFDADTVSDSEIDYTTVTLADFTNDADYVKWANATSSLWQSTGLLSTASSTIGNGAQAGGLTISGGATTSGNLLVQGNTTLASATSTNFAISSIASGNLLKTTAGGAIIAAVSGTDYATPSQITSSYPFTTTTHFGTTTSATSTPLFLRGSQYALFASSTSVFDNASTTALTIGLDFVTSLTGDALELSAAGVLNVNDVTAAMLASADFGDFTCGGVTCSLDADTVGTAEFADEDWGELTASGGVVAIDADVIEVANIADGDWGDFTITTNVASLDADTVSDSEIDYTNVTLAAFTNDAGFTTFAYPFPSDATSTKLSFTGGLLSTASTTIGNGTQTGGLTISGGATTSGNSILQGTLTVSGNTTLANATTTGLAVTSITSSLLKTDSSGNLLAAVAGTDYANFQFPWTQTTFGGTNANSTSTLIGFTNGIYSLASSTIGNGTQTGGLTISGGATTSGNSVLQGTLSVTGNTTLADATSTGFAITTLSSELLKVDGSGNVLEAIAGTDYATPSQITSSYPFTPTTHFGTTTAATSTPLFLRGSQYALFASSTSVFDNASTTLLSICAYLIIHISGDAL